MLLWILRGCFAVLMIGVSYLAFDHFLTLENYVTSIVALVAMLLLGGGVMLLDLRVKNKEITTISAVIFGSLLGLLLGTLFSYALTPILGGGEANKRIVQIVNLLITAICCYTAISVLLQTKDEF